MSIRRLPSKKKVQKTHRLKPGETDLVTSVAWVSADDTCDLDLSCALFDKKGRWLETVDFNDTKSNCGAVWSAGDTVGANMEGDGIEKEEIWFDLRNINPKVHALVVWVTCFNSGFGQSQVSRITSDTMRFTFAEEKTKKVQQDPLSRTVKDRALMMHLAQDFGSTDPNNVVVLHKFYRNKSDKSASAAGGASTAPEAPGDSSGWSIGSIMKPARLNSKLEIQKIMRKCLSDIYPWLREVKQYLIDDVTALCALLSSKSMPRLKPFFEADVSGGLKLEKFTEVLLRQLMRNDELKGGLADPEECANAVALLHELFNQIDINGDEEVDWEEFTSFCIEVGMISTHQSNELELDEYTVQYMHDTMFVDRSLTRALPVRCMVEILDLERILLVEQNSPQFNVYNLDMVLQHFHRFDEDSHPGMYIIDVAYLYRLRMLAVSGSDHVVYLLQEHLSTSGSHKFYSIYEQCLNESLQVKLAWCPANYRLLSIDPANNFYMWPMDPETFEEDAPPHRPKLPPHRPHKDVITDVLYIKDRGLIATSSLDKRIVLWGLDNMRERGVLLGHKLGIRKMAYANGMLISVGFEYDAIVWDITSKAQSLLLRGHRHPIASVRILAVHREHTLKAVTVDDSCSFRVWELVSGESGGGVGHCIQEFPLPYNDPNGPIRCIALPFSTSRSIREFSDLLIGASRPTRMLPNKIMKEFVDPVRATFNGVASHFVCAIGDSIHLWDMRDGEHLDRFHDISSSAKDISSMCIDQPRQRRIYVGLEDGHVVILNYVTGDVLSKYQVFDGEVFRSVTSICFCEKTKCLICTSAEGDICILHDTRTGLSRLRTVNEAHVGSIACCAYSYSMSIILTGGSTDSTISVWDFQSMQRRCQAPVKANAVTSLSLHPTRPIFVCGDGTERVLMCHIDLIYNRIVCLAAFTPLAVAPSMGLENGRKNEAVDHATATTVLWDDPITGAYQEGLVTTVDEATGEKTTTTGPKNYSLVVGTETGNIVLWDYASIYQRFQKKVAHVPQDTCPPFMDNFRPHLRLERSMGKYGEGTLQQLMPQVLEPQIHMVEKQRWTAHKQHQGLGVTGAYFFPFGGKSNWFLYTAGHDGFQRVWDVEANELKGIIRLPNVEDSLYKNVEHIEWDLRAHHVDIAEEHRLIAKIALGLAEKPRAAKPSLSGLVVGGSAAGIDIDPNAEVSEEDLLFYSTIAMKRKAEKDKATPKNTKDRIASKRDLNKHILLQVKTNASGGKFTSELRAEAEGKNDGRLQLSDAEMFQSVASQYRPREAFSDISIRSGMQEGLFGFDGYKQLKSVNTSRQRKEAYDRGFPNIRPVKSIFEYRLQKLQRARAASLAGPSGGGGAKGKKKKKGAASRPSTTGNFERVQTTHNFDDLNVSGPAEGANSADLRVMMQGEKVLFSPGKHATVTRSEGHSAMDDIKKRMAKTLEKEDSLEAEEQKELDARAQTATAGKRPRPKQPWDRSRPSSAPGDSVEGPSPRRSHKAEIAIIDLNSLRKGAFGPHYSLAEVLKFRQNFNSVDIDMSGNMDMTEWQQFLQRMNQAMTPTDAQLLFMHIDKDRSGTPIDLSVLCCNHIHF